MEKRTAGTLQRDFIVAPYSVIDARTVLWQEKKRAWRDIIGYTGESREEALYDSAAMRMPDLYAKSEEARRQTTMNFEEYAETNASIKDKAAQEYGGVSTFDPVLAEVIYHWFAPGKGTKIFDPFAGGVTKGAVAAMCGHYFTGIELRPEQVEINNSKVRESGWNAKYICDDGCNVNAHVGYATQDLLISCPPYYDLEIYSDLPNDASNKGTYEEYLVLLRCAFNAAIKALKQNRFAVIVVSDVRDENGAYRNLPGDVVKIFRDAGLYLWNEIILHNQDASAKLRARGYMNQRKTVRVHQKVLVFYNGRPTAIKKHFSSLRQ